MSVSKTSDTTGLFKASGKHYLDVLGDLHHTLSPEWYLEIGTQTGKSLQKSNANTVAIDPEFRLKRKFWRRSTIDRKFWNRSAELHLFEMTSDEFFQQDHLNKLGCRFKLAFLDGMHLYEFLLRDFINAEKNMLPSGCIVLHDCLPWSTNMAQRDRSKVDGHAWTGDVWKVVAILQKFRPDLTVRILDAEPTGLVMVTGLDPKNTALSQGYDKIIEEYDAAQDLVAFVQSLTIESADEGAHLDLNSTSKDSIHFAIKTSVPRPAAQDAWGDHHFAVGLKSALEKLGQSATIRTREDWLSVERNDEVDLVINGKVPHPRRAGHTALQWLISSNEATDCDHCFVASPIVLRSLQESTENLEMSLLPQAFDENRFFPPSNDSDRSGAIFVGIARSWRRPIVDLAIEAGIDLQIWGKGWRKDRKTIKYARGDRLSNSRLREKYSKAEIVLNDHTPLMMENGLLSNRVFDALACATPVISDPVRWIPDDIKPFVETASNKQEFLAAVEKIRSEGPDQKLTRLNFAHKMRDEHSFGSRAREILAIARQKQQLADPE